MANKGKLLVDATVAPQNISFPTDLKLLDAARRKSEELVDKLYDVLRPLPSTAFFLKKVVQLTVQRNYHIQYA